MGKAMIAVSKRAQRGQRQRVEKGFSTRWQVQVVV